MPLSALLAVAFTMSCALPAAGQMLDGRMHHLRSGAGPEWIEFASSSPSGFFTLSFNTTHAFPHTLRLRQENVRREWRLLVNGHLIGQLYLDENPITAYWDIPRGAVRSGRNVLRIEPADTTADDILVGEIMLYEAPVQEVLSGASIEVEIRDGETGEAIPSRVTIVDRNGVLQTVGTDRIAARPGFVYTPGGNASFGLPPGEYTLYAGRGTEYSVDSSRVVLNEGDRAFHTFTIRREVPTEGWVASDTHIHTLTHSGHGDATAEERLITIAAEGIELPIITEHNLHLDLAPLAEEMGLSRYFTPVIGNEVTTGVGHFNVFPVDSEIDHLGEDWDDIARSLSHVAGHPVIILNHPRDTHRGFRPLDPEKHVSAAGLRLDRWSLPANAMEVINSGAQQTHMMRLVSDWFGMLNGGHNLSPIGSSDSHDVGRYLVGQARTYIRAADADAGQIDVQEAVRSLRSGAVGVSFGLVAEMTVNGAFGAGELVPASDSLVVEVRVLGPSWLRAEKVSLYANGEKIREEAISTQSAAGVKWRGGWTLPRPRHDVFLVAVAEGPSDRLPFWPIARPYQHATPEWNPQIMGLTGAIWIDADGDGSPTAARAYASRLMVEGEGNPDAVVDLLAGYDEAVAAQAAALLYQEGMSTADLSKAAEGAPPFVMRGFESVIEAVRN